jgi:hypothetical protein
MKTMSVLDYLSRDKKEQINTQTEGLSLLWMRMPITDAFPIIRLEHMTNLQFPLQRVVA